MVRPPGSVKPTYAIEWIKLAMGLAVVRVG
jgi:hypothetical protein